MTWPGGIELIKTFSNGTYQPVEGGEKAVLLAVDHEVTDIVAWLWGKPDHWWTRHGDAPLLNPDAIDLSVGLRHPLRIFPSPRAWLLGKGKGVVILDDTADLRFWFGGVERLLVHDQAALTRIESAFQERRPEVRVDAIA